MSLWATTAALTLALTSTPQGQQTPSFRTGVDLVTIEVRVLDRQGRPIPNLRPEDFQVELDGRRRPVQAIEYVVLSPSVTPGAAPVETPRFQAATPDSEGRSVLIAFDDVSFRGFDARPLLADVGRWLARLDPLDRVGVTTTSGIGPEDVVFTRDRQQTVRELSGLVGRRTPQTPGRIRYVVTVEEAYAFEGLRVLRETGQLPPFVPGIALRAANRECTGDLAPSNDSLTQDCFYDVADAAADVRLSAQMDGQRQLSGLSRILKIAAGIPPLRVLVLLSHGLPVESMWDLTPFKTAVDLGLASYVLAPTRPALNAELPWSRSVSEDPITGEMRTGLSSDDAAKLNDAFGFLGLESFAGVTNGTAHRVVGSPDQFLNKVLVETSAYYRLGVEAPPGGGDWMSLKITTRRGGASVRAASRIAKPGVAAEPASPISLEERLANVVRRGGLVRGLRVELGTVLSRDSRGQGLQLAANVLLREARPGPLEGMFALVAEGGRIVTDGTLTLAARSGEPGYRAAFHLPVPPGRYLLRLAVADAGGDIGLAEQEVVARLARIGDHHASGLIVAWSGEDGRLHYPELDEVPAAAVTLRPALELYAAEGRPTVVPRVQLHLEPMTGGSVIIREMEVTVAGTMARARADIAMVSLPPGAYTLRAVVFGENGEAGVVTTRLHVLRP